MVNSEGIGEECDQEVRWREDFNSKKGSPVRIAGDSTGIQELKATSGRLHYNEKHIHHSIGRRMLMRESGGKLADIGASLSSWICDHS